MVLFDSDLAKRDGFEVRALALAGRGTAPMAYLLRWAGKAVLVSGRIPEKLTLPGAEALQHEIRGTDGAAAQYVQALRRLAEMSPALWLPAVPVQGQNANLYDDDWAKVVEQNRQMFE